MLIAYDYGNHRALVTDADCNSWRCPECASAMRDRWQLRAAHGAKMLQDDGETLYFATITSHEKNTTFDACARAFPDAWGKLHKRLNRTSETREYLLVPERHKDGRMHMHAIWTFPVKTRWLKDNGRECGFGYMNQVGRRGHVDEPVGELAQVGRYVAKYLGKALGDNVPLRFRRVRTSSGWSPLPEPVTGSDALVWKYIGGNGALNAAYEECARAHLTMIDVRTGQIFEDEDLGTIAWD